MIILMENEKNATKSLYAKGPIFFNIGLIIAITLCFIAFEFKVYIEEAETVKLPDEDQLILFAMDDPKTTLQPPKVKPFIPEKRNTEINIVDEKELVDTEDKTDKPPVDINEMKNFLDGQAPDPEEVEDNTEYIVVESGANFPGGMSAFYKFMGSEIKYPKREQKMNIDGRVIVSFVIEKDGSLTDFTVLKGVSKGLDDEAIRVLKASPTWNPGKQRGKEVRVRMTIPILFQLN
jgi:protein TonB